MILLQNGTFNFLPQGTTKLSQGQIQHKTEMKQTLPHPLLPEDFHTGQENLEPTFVLRKQKEF